MRAGPIPGNGVEVVDRSQRAMGLTPVEDLLRRDRADAGEGVELLERCAREAHLAPGRPAPQPPRLRRPTPGGDAHRDHDLLPVRHGCREVDEREVGAAARSARPLEGVGHTRALRDAHETRAPDRADDVDDEPRRGRSPPAGAVSERQRRCLRRRSTGGARRGQALADERKHDDADEEEKCRVTAGEPFEDHVVNIGNEGVTRDASTPSRMCADRSTAPRRPAGTCATNTCSLESTAPPPARRSRPKEEHAPLRDRTAIDVRGARRGGAARRGDARRRRSIRPSATARGGPVTLTLGPTGAIIVHVEPGDVPHGRLPAQAPVPDRDVHLLDARRAVAVLDGAARGGVRHRARGGSRERGTFTAEDGTGNPASRRRRPRRPRSIRPRRLAGTRHRARKIRPEEPRARAPTRLTTAALAAELAKVVHGQDAALERVASVTVAQLAQAASSPARLGAARRPDGRRQDEHRRGTPGRARGARRRGRHCLPARLRGADGLDPGHAAARRAARLHGPCSTTPLLAALEKPVSILLVDEVEKAHAEVRDLLLGLLDAGRLTSPPGRSSTRATSSSR